MVGPSTFSHSSNNVGLDSLEFPRLTEQLNRLTSQGVDIHDPQLWHPNALLAAADLMGVDDSRAFIVSGQASMLVASMLTFEDAAAQPVELEVRHTDGAVARLSLGFTATTDEVKDSQDDPANHASSDETLEKEKRLWVKRTSVDPASIQELVETFAKTTGATPGGYASVVGAGAVLAAIQSLEAMNAASASFGFEGLGDDDHSFEFVSLRLSITPSPAPVLSRGPKP